MEEQYTPDLTFVQSIRAAALHVASIGFKVHPVHGIDDSGRCTCGKGPNCNSPGKHPVLSGFLEQATTDPEVINSWPWEAGYNLGIVPGDEICILDFDGPKGKATLNAMMDWCPALQGEGYGLLVTGSGGIHLVGRGKAQSYVRRLPGMDVRGVGGQAVIAPSRHYSGNYYSALRPLDKMVDPFPPEVLAVANGDFLPPELETPEIVTIDDLKALARRKTKYQTAWKAIVEGKPYATTGERDTITTGLVGVLAKKWPKAEPTQVAKLFEPSLIAMSSEPEPIAVEDVASKLQRFKTIERENRNGLSSIMITTEIGDMARQAMEALAVYENRSIYKRGGMLSFISYNQNLPGLAPRDEEPPKIRTAPLSVIKGELSQAASWVKRNRDGEMVSKLPPNEVCAYVTDIGEWKQVPYLEGIASGPFIRSDGSIFRGEGYDPHTGLFSLGQRIDWDFVPKDQALAELWHVFGDFPFKKGHYESTLAALLTGVGRYAFKGPSPLFFFDANTRGAGKTLCANVVAKIVSAGGATAASLGHDNEEDRKQLTSLAMGGAETVMVDNVTGRFGTGKLCEALTLHDGIWADRVLGKNTTWSGPFRPLWLATGNNVLLRADMSRRTCYCRLESPHERPEERTDFKVPSLMGYVTENRERLHWCALSILKAYWEAGCPLNPNMRAWGGFEGWSNLIRGAITWCGYADPAATVQELAFSDDDHDYGRILVEGIGLLTAENNGPMKCSEMVQNLYGFGTTAAEAEQYQDLREAIEALTPRRNGTPTPQSVGKLLQRYRGRVFNNRSVEQCGVNGRQWRVVIKEECAE